VSLIEAFSSNAPVVGSTHTFYRYPARFSPQFARAVIERFSQPGDCVLDPFMGGGTSIVEALRTGRAAIGIDLNALACFVASVKTTPLSENDHDRILHWIATLDHRFDRRAKKPRERITNLPTAAYSLLQEFASNIDTMPFRRQREFARCALLKTGQWALDCRDQLPTKRAFKDRLRVNTIDMLASIRDFATDCRAAGFARNQITNQRRLLCRSVLSIDARTALLSEENRPKLVLTSPPYPGVHVLYHRWQINGRRETPAPYWLLSLNDGFGEAYYTLGGRSTTGVKNYFNSITQAFQSIRKAIHRQAHVVQLVAFAEKRSQLPLYLRAMREAGYMEVNDAITLRASRAWRTVPNRRWYSQMRLDHDAAREVLLIHKVIQ